MILCMTLTVDCSRNSNFTSSNYTYSYEMIRAVVKINFLETKTSNTRDQVKTVSKRKRQESRYLLNFELNVQCLFSEQ